jgi:SSS family solute:Na+ symporter
MSIWDYIIFLIYMTTVLYIGWYFYRRNKDHDDYFVGGRNMGAGHIGLSVVATDVGGGFSIGLGGLGFMMGISGSWMLFTGLLGAWLSAVFLIPRVLPASRKNGWLTFPQMLASSYGKGIALMAGVISGLGYLGFTSAQLLAGAKLAKGTFPDLDMPVALLIMGVIAVGYTVIGGIKAVIYTDTFQWAILMVGLIAVGLPLGYKAVGGIEGLRSSLPASFLDISALSPAQMINWFFTIVPIWFVGMTLYQRIYACRDVKTAKRAWYLAGLFEYPVMAFMGVILGLFARAGAEQGMFASLGLSLSEIDAEMGLPLLLRTVLPAGLLGLMLAAYFSAIMSTADSCLMAASGNLVTDILNISPQRHPAGYMRFAQWGTLGLGVVAILLALFMENVLTLMLHSYAFMVSGLLFPVLGHLFLKKPHRLAAAAAMIGGGVITLFFTITQLPIFFDLDPIIPGLLVSGTLFFSLHYLIPRNGLSHTK